LIIYEIDLIGTGDHIDRNISLHFIISFLTNNPLTIRILNSLKIQKRF
jgi:hypothetical protein